MDHGVIHMVLCADLRDAGSGQSVGVRRTAVHPVNWRLLRAVVPRPSHRQTLRSVNSTYCTTRSARTAQPSARDVYLLAQSVKPPDS